MTIKRSKRTRNIRRIDSLSSVEEAYGKLMEYIERGILQFNLCGRDVDKGIDYNIYFEIEKAYLNHGKIDIVYLTRDAQVPPTSEGMYIMALRNRVVRECIEKELPDVFPFVGDLVFCGDYSLEVHEKHSEYGCHGR